nr:hypothetical protein CFP56_48687 [Quercus suber]
MHANFHWERRRGVRDLRRPICRSLISFGLECPSGGHAEEFHHPGCVQAERHKRGLGQAAQASTQSAKAISVTCVFLKFDCLTANELTGMWHESVTQRLACSNGGLVAVLLQGRASRRSLIGLASHHAPTLFQWDAASRADCHRPVPLGLDDLPFGACRLIRSVVTVTIP